MRHGLVQRCIRVAVTLPLLLTLRPILASAFDIKGASVELELQLPDGEGGFEQIVDEETIKEHFNLAHCICVETQFAVEFTLVDAPPTLDTENVDIWVGSNCDADEVDIRDQTCERVGGFDDIEDLRSPQTLGIAVHRLVATNSTTCDADDGSRLVYALIDEQNDGIGPEDYVAPPLDIPFDMIPPPRPSAIEVSGGENAIQLRWDLPSSRTEDVRHFQVLCARADGSVASSDDFPRNGARYLTSRMACGVDDGTHPEPLAPGDSDLSDAGPGQPMMPLSLFNLDASTVCAEVGGTNTATRIDGLENGVPYRVVLAMVDDYRNVLALDLGQHTPQSVKDAWEHYKDSGGAADGGFCFVATATYGTYEHPFVRVLRDFRDDSLAHRAWGRSIIRWYYRNSPKLANFIANHEVARALSYVLLLPVVTLAAIWEYTGPLGKMALLIVILVLMSFRRRLRRTARSTNDLTRARKISRETAANPL